MLYKIKMVLQNKAPTTTAKQKVNYTTCLGVNFVIEFEQLQTESPHKVNNNKNLVHQLQCDT